MKQSENSGFARLIVIAAAIGAWGCGEEGPTSPGAAGGEGSTAGPTSMASADVAADVVTTFTVLNTDDAGPGSLRQAILDANASAGLDLIEFDIAGAGPHTIQPLSPLPGVADPVVIDGYTQVGASANTNGPGQGLNTVLMVELDGSLAGTPANGLGFGPGSDNSVARGLAINGFQGTGAFTGGNGIVICCGASNVRVEGNFIGTDVAGTTAQGNGANGVVVSFSALDNAVGGTLPAARNLISGNGDGATANPDRNGVKIVRGSSNNLVQGNLIGPDITGTAALGNWTGVSLGDSDVSDNLIGGATPAARNVISGNSYSGVTLNGTIDAGAIKGNYIGIDVTGTAALGNATAGIAVFSSADFIIGGSEPGAGNVISGNGNTGIDLGGARFVIQGNLFGTNAAGTATLGGGGRAILSRGNGDENLIGGTTPGAGNLIVGGLLIAAGGTGNLVQGNRIGTDVTGAVALGGGIQLEGSDNLVGGTEPAARNVISGGGTGISVSGADNRVQGNFIGTDITGTVRVGNAFGVLLNGQDNVVGGTAAGAGNLISGNLRGVQVGTTGGVVQGNLIGTDVTGSAPLGNTENGVLVIYSASGNLIGGTEPGAGNVIAYNGEAGVAVAGTTNIENAILSNSIFSNGGLGIDLALDLRDPDLTPNDPGDADEGPNRLMNFPVLTQALATRVRLVVRGTVDTPSPETVTVQIFANTVPDPGGDPSGHGEGERLVGSATPGTDGVFTAVLSPVAPGTLLSATATDAAGNTSEFSENLPAAAPQRGQPGG